VIFKLNFKFYYEKIWVFVHFIRIYIPGAGARQKNFGSGSSKMFLLLRLQLGGSATLAGASY
jgi:hypothetical protein